MMDALLDGNYSGLTHLRFGRIDSGSNLALVALARVLSSGKCPHLEELRMGSWAGPNHIEDYEDDDVDLSLRLILEAIGAGCCRQLRRLGIVDAPVDTNHARMLGQALRDGACPLLEDLDLNYSNELSGRGLVHVFDALEYGACPHLKTIKVESIHLGPRGQHLWCMP